MKRGVWLFLAFEAVLFGGLFSAYFVLRAGAITWGWSSHRALGQLNTGLLLLGTIALMLGVVAARSKRLALFRACMAISLLLALAFLGVKAYEYVDDFAMALYPRVSTRIALYYLLTGVHALHVVAGTIVTAWLALAGTQVWTQSAAVIINRLEAALLYWIFVDAMWVIVFVLLYVW